MAFTEVKAGDSINYIRPSKLSEEGKTGLILEGEYLGPVLNSMSEKNDYKFKTEDGIAVINNTGGLQVRMEQIDPGTLVQIHYNGKTEIQNGKMKGKQAHNFVVLVEDGE